MNKELGVSTVTERKTKFGIIHYIRVPSECSLVKERVVLGRKIDDKPGLKIVSPFTRTTVITNNYIPLDPAKISLPCKSGYDVTIDIIAKIWISDVDTFERENREGNLEQLIMSDIDSKVRAFVADRTYEELLASTRRNNIIGIKKKNNARNNNTNAQQTGYFDDIIAEIEENYGVTISSIKFTSVEPPEYIKRVNEQRKEAEEKRKIAAEEARGRKEVAKIDQETKKIEMETIIETATAYINHIVPLLKQQNMSDDMIRDYIMANLPNAINIVGGQGYSNASVQDGVNFGIGMEAARRRAK